MKRRQDDMSSCNEYRNRNESLQDNDHSILDGILKDEIQQKTEKKTSWFIIPVFELAVRALE